MDDSPHPIPDTPTRDENSTTASPSESVRPVLGQTKISDLAVSQSEPIYDSQFQGRFEKYFVPPPPPEYMENVAPVGGALASLILGIWGLVTVFFTAWSFLNGLMGIPLGLWGLGSRRPKLAILGLVLNCLTLLFAMFRSQL